jgi:uncharacterized protein YhbP (UPF0306 family)
MYLESKGKESLEYVLNAIRKIIDDNYLLALSTFAHGTLWTSTVFYSYDEDLNIYFVSDPRTRHCKMIENNPEVSLAIYDTNAIWGTNIQGVQLEGHVKKLSVVQTIAHGSSYLQRFPVAKTIFRSPEMLASDRMAARLYQIKPKIIQLYDEVSLPEDEPIQRVIFD